MDRGGIASSYPGIIHSPGDKDSSNCHLVWKKMIDLERNFKRLMLGVTLIYETRIQGRVGEGTDLPNNLPKKRTPVFRLPADWCACVAIASGLGETIIRGADTIDVNRV